jgi:hypothetical protein
MDKKKRKERPILQSEEVRKKLPVLNIGITTTWWNAANNNSVDM